MDTQRWLKAGALFVLIGAAVTATAAGPAGREESRAEVEFRSGAPDPGKGAAGSVRLQPGQFGEWVVDASSILEPQAGNTYGPGNLFGDGSGERAWIEGAKGDGVGEWVQVFFGDQTNDLTFATVLVRNGYGKNREVFAKNNRVRNLRVSHAEGEEVVALEDRQGLQRIGLARPARSHWVRLTIESVYRGTTYRDTAISSLGFDIEAFNYYPPLEGSELRSPDGKLSAWEIPVKARDDSSVESRVQVWEARVSPGQAMPRVVGARDHTSESGMHGRGVAEATWTRDGRFFVYTTNSSGGHSPWHATGYFFDRETGRVECLDDFGIVVVREAIKALVADAIEVVAQRRPGDIEGAPVRVVLSKVEKTRKR